MARPNNKSNGTGKSNDSGLNFEAQRPEAADERDFSLSASNGERVGGNCRILFPPVNNANFAWDQHFIHHLALRGMAGLNAVRQEIANGSMSSNQSGEGDILGYQPWPLATLRETLLPKLLSGELSVQGATN